MPELLIATAQPRDDGRIEVRSPGVGFWSGAPAAGAHLDGHTPLGRLETLGVIRSLRVPEELTGIVAESHAGADAQRPVEYGELLLVVDPETAPESTAEQRVTARGLVFAAPMSGRFYLRPAPDKPAFIEAGQEIAEGDTVCLLEVMKTFNRLRYGGDGLPKRARIAAIVPADGDDLNRGDPILELER